MSQKTIVNKKLKEAVKYAINQEKELKIYLMKILKIRKFLNIKIRKFGMDFKRKWVICMKNFEPYYGEDVKKSVDCRKNGTKRRGGTKMNKQEIEKLDKE